MRRGCSCISLSAVNRGIVRRSESVLDEEIGRFFFESANMYTLAVTIVLKIVLVSCLD